MRASTKANLTSLLCSAFHSDDFVRAPIAPVRQVLVEDDYGAGYRTRRAPNSVFDAFRDFQAETSECCFWS